MAKKRRLSGIDLRKHYSTYILGEGTMWNWFFGGYYGGGTSGGDTGSASAVPEMDAASGTLAVAVVLAALVLTWEIKRRRRARG